MASCDNRLGKPGGSQSRPEPGGGRVGWRAGSEGKGRPGGPELVTAHTGQRGAR